LSTRENPPYLDLPWYTIWFHHDVPGCWRTGVPACRWHIYITPDLFSTSDFRTKNIIVYGGLLIWYFYGFLFVFFHRYWSVYLIHFKSIVKKIIVYINLYQENLWRNCWHKIYRFRPQYTTLLCTCILITCIILPDITHNARYPWCHLLMTEDLLCSVKMNNQFFSNHIITYKYWNNTFVLWLPLVDSSIIWYLIRFEITKAPVHKIIWLVSKRVFVVFFNFLVPFGAVVVVIAW